MEEDIEEEAYADGEEGQQQHETLDSTANGGAVAPEATNPRRATTKQAIPSLIVTQETIRNVDNLHTMAEYVKSGGLFSIDAMQEHSRLQHSSSSSMQKTAPAAGSKGKKPPSRQQKIKNKSAPKEKVQYGKSRMQKPKLIILAKFPDDRMYIWDGHHRVAAIFMGGRQELEPSEYTVMICNFEFATTVHLAKWFVTPFDPRTEIRVCDLGPFKDQVADLLHKKKKSKDEVVKFIMENKERYVKKREYDGVDALIKLVLDTNEDTSLKGTEASKEKE